MIRIFLPVFLTTILSHISFAAPSPEPTLSHTVLRSVRVSEMQIIPIVQRIKCKHYHDDNDYDGECEEWEYRCLFRIQIRKSNFLGKDEVYDFHEPSPAFPGLDLSSGKECISRTEIWAKLNHNLTVRYTLHEDLFRSFYVRGRERDSTKVCLEVLRIEGNALFQGEPNVRPLVGLPEGIVSNLSVQRNLDPSSPECRDSRDIP